MEWPPQNTGLFGVALCAFCQVTPVDKMEVRYYGDNFVSMYGFDALDGSGGRWRSQSGSGSFNINYYNDGGCGDFGASDTAGIYGSACAMDRYGVVTGDCPSINTSGTVAENYDGGVATPSTYVLSANGSCIDAAIGPFQSLTVTGAQTITLGDPWTEADAIAESEAFGVSDWFEIAPDAYVIDSWIPWDGTSNIVEYARLDFRRTKNGYNPSTLYNVSMDVYRDGVLYATLEDTITSDAAGVLTWTGAYPHDRGHRFNILGSTFAAVPA